MIYQDSSGSYLDIGDVVLYGKFKNAKGRIVSFGQNEKGDPTIQVQPIGPDGQPKKGQPKTITLLKVRKVTKTASRQRVARRYLYARLFQAMSLEKARSVLGFPPDSNPSPEEVRRAQKKQTFKYHPDRGGDPAKMVEINVAADILTGKEHPRSDRTPSPKPEPPAPPPKPEVPVVSFKDAWAAANIPNNTYWIWVTEYRNRPLSDDEILEGGIDTGWVAYGRNYDNMSHVFVLVGTGAFWEQPGDPATWWVGTPVIIPKRMTTAQAVARGMKKAVQQLPGLKPENKIYLLSFSLQGRRYIEAKDFEEPRGSVTTIQQWLKDIGEEKQEPLTVILELRRLSDYKRQMVIIVNGRETIIDSDSKVEVERKLLSSKMFTKSQLDYWRGSKNLTKMRSLTPLYELFKIVVLDLPKEDADKIREVLKRAGVTS